MKMSKRLLCLECGRVYNRKEEIKTERNPNFLWVVVNQICGCGAVNRFRPEAYWTEEDKKIAKGVR